MKPEALQALRQSTAVMLKPSDVAPVLGCKPYSLTLQAREDPSALGFPVCVMGTRVRIPRVPFLNWIDGEAGA